MKNLNQLLLAGLEAGVTDFAVHVGEKLESGDIEVVVKSGDQYADVHVNGTATVVKFSNFGFFPLEEGGCCAGGQHAGEAEKPAEGNGAEAPGSADETKTEG